MSSQSPLCNNEKNASDDQYRISTKPDFQLIETMRYEPVSGILRFDLHMQRLENSAKSLRFPFDEEAVRHAIKAKAQGDTALRLRLTLDPDGMINATSTIFTPLPPQTIWRLAIAKTRINSSDPLLAHKTTRRAVYDAAREEYARDAIDEVILLNEKDQLCEGTITSLFIEPTGKLLTPALECGLLAGVLRREMIEKHIAKEAIVTVNDLRTAKQILVGNSLRGLIRAEIVDE